MQNIRQLIEECGGKMEHLCKVVVYLTDVRHREAVYRTMGEYIKACTGVDRRGCDRTRAALVAGRDRRHRRHPD